MEQNKTNQTNELTALFFRSEYGKMVAVVTKYIGTENVTTAEDIVQETLLKAVNHWQLTGIPENPQAWLYTTAKNLTFNVLKRKKIEAKYRSEPIDVDESSSTNEVMTFTANEIVDQQLNMMFVCCHPSISENTQVALILNILCGFRIAEIAHAFFSNIETINKRLVRGRQQLRQNFDFASQPNVNERLPIVLRSIYLLFNEGYLPSQKEEVTRYDLSLEAIRLVNILLKSPLIHDKSDSHALLALMYLNASRFDARENSTNTIVEMSDQNRKKWNRDLINRGIDALNQAIKENRVSIYLILATISAQHCIAPSLDKTNWNQILSLYDDLLELNDSSIVKLNRSVALAKVKGNKTAISELESIEVEFKLEQNHLFHATLGELYRLDNEGIKAIEHFNKAIKLAKNQRDVKFLQRKLVSVVPNGQAQVS
ncbi:MAG: RNA polymerase subunit sigma [Saprospiraceae bacterium]|nr:RNA polymerase subunit sigma [Saprospiraceae bacterium]